MIEDILTTLLLLLFLFVSIARDTHPSVLRTAFSFILNFFFFCVSVQTVLELLSPRVCVGGEGGLLPSCLDMCGFNTFLSIHFFRGKRLIKLAIK